MIFYINNIDQNLFEINASKRKDFLLKIEEFIKKVKKEGYGVSDTIYYISNSPVILDDKIVTKIEQIQIIISDNFPYVLKQLASHNKVESDTIIFSNSLWEYYLIKYGIKVYNYKNNKIIEIDYSFIHKKFWFKPWEIDYLNDYIFLQEKNEENGLGEKKTRELLLENHGIERLLDNVNNIENIRSRELINYQRKKINFYASTLKRIFIDSSEVYAQKK